MKRWLWRSRCLSIAALNLAFLSAAGADEITKPTDKPSATAPEAPPKRSAQEDYELYQIFVDTLDQVERNYVKDVSRRELMEAAIEGVLTKLDPYSSYINRDDLGRFKTTVESQFGGIGIQVGMDGGQLKVVSPLVGTPAYRAGIQAGDSILEIEGKPTAGFTLEDAVREMKGEAGTSVTLTIQHAGSTEKKQVTVTRELIHVETVMGDRRKADDSWDFMLDHDQHIGYIRISAFSRDTTADLKKALTQLQEQGLKGLILDLRFNPGGLLTAAIEISDLFVAEGRIVSTQGRNTPERTWEAVKDGTFEGFPMVVLTNRYSASASEIVAACLQDHNRAVIIGERTWGKGSVQNVIELEGGKSALKLTTAGYRRPNGHNIHRFPDSKESDEWGVMPNDGMELKLADAEMARLIRTRRERDILSAPRNAATDAATAPAEGESKPEDEAKPEAEAGSADDADAPEAKPAAEGTADVSAEQAKTNPATAADRQLQKALDYLTGQIAQAP